MAWYILTWNPETWHGIKDSEWNEFAALGDSDLVEGSWSSGGRKSGIEPGDGIIFLRQGSQCRGILAIGQATSEIYEDEHYNDPGKTARYVDYRWTSVCTIENRIPTEWLLDSVPDIHWNNLQGSGVAIADQWVDVILGRWNGRSVCVGGTSSKDARMESEQDSLLFDPYDLTDQREWVIQEVPQRRGQDRFRRRLIEAYGEQCAISGCTVSKAIQAAHIVPYRGDVTNDVHNGLLLRADLHLLFDQGLIKVEPVALRVQLSPSLLETDYRVFQGKPLHLGAQPKKRPSPKALRWHLEQPEK